nr:zinc finger protein 90-like [Rhipicephalus microplus]
MAVFFFFFAVRKTNLPARFEHFDLDDDSGDALDVTVEECASAATAQDVAGVNVSTPGPSRAAVRKGVRGRFPCKKCGRRFDSLLRRTKHQLTHTGSARGATTLECSECKRKFSSRLTLAEHQAWHENRMLYSCPICGRQFRQNAGLWRHQMTHNRDVQKRRYPCPRCGQDFARPGYLKEHLASHEESHRSRFACDVCQRTFFQRCDLSRHRKTHDGKQQFECAICKRGFSSLASQRRHEKEHDPARKAPCPECGATFTRPCQLKVHIAKYHGDAMLLKPLVPKKRPGQSTGALRMERKLLSQHCDNSAALQRIDGNTTDGLPTQAKGMKYSLLREKLTTPVDVAPMSILQICSSSELNRNPGQLQEQHSICGSTATEFGASCALSSNVTAQSKEPTEQTPTGMGRLAILRGSGSAVSEAADLADKLQCSLKELPIEGIQGDLRAESGTNFVDHPDFQSQAYYDWLSRFTSTCNLAAVPLDTEMLKKVNQVLKAVSDALATPLGALACRENFTALLGIREDLYRTVRSHLDYVLGTLKPSWSSHF